MLRSCFSANTERLRSGRNRRLQLVRISNLLHQIGVNRTAGVTAITRATSFKGSTFQEAAADYNVNKRAATGTGDDCNDGYRSSTDGICKVCSAPEILQEEVICPCTKKYNTVLGCKPEYAGFAWCLPRAEALNQCGNREITSSGSPISETTTDPHVVVPGLIVTSHVLEERSTTALLNNTKFGNIDTWQLFGNPADNIATATSDNSADGLLLESVAAEIPEQNVHTVPSEPVTASNDPDDSILSTEKSASAQRCSFRNNVQNTKGLQWGCGMETPEGDSADFSHCHALASQ